MSKTVLVSDIKEFAICLGKFNKPVTIEEILKACNIIMKNIPTNQSQIKGQLESILETGVKLGYLKKCNDHYSASTLVDDEVVTLVDDEVVTLNYNLDPQLRDITPDEVLRMLLPEPPINSDDDSSDDEANDNTAV
ncbi:uncharacterized protein LOC117787419 [Drosophila innubila]|uniref:uncharacterized protein LOC117787419 n=1 Tax=Drosophila innubila TaxID=198719 RepID=UPI00148E83B5|nr:uncharacterized protein LOC117787419 [Drosophila innubila]XP_034481830.1 uncharacterized protein LOC117787419 [Drosophila innubila]